MPSTKTGTGIMPRKGKSQKQRRFLNREQRELEELPMEIEGLESEQEKLATDLANPEVLKGDPSFSIQAQKRLKEIDDALHQKYGRWEELETLKKKLQ